MNCNSQVARKKSSMTSNTYSKDNVKVHEINRFRQKHGEYHTLMPLLRRNEKKFYEYLRMPVNCFDYILKNVEKDLNRSWCNLHKQPIKAEEKLVVSLR